MNANSQVLIISKLGSDSTLKTNNLKFTLKRQESFELKLNLNDMVEKLVLIDLGTLNMKINGMKWTFMLKIGSISALMRFASISLLSLTYCVYWWSQWRGSKTFHICGTYKGNAHFNTKSMRIIKLCRREN